MQFVVSWRDLIVWRKAHQVALVVCRVANSLPAPWQVGLTSQLIRASISVPTNIAEGKGRNSVAEFRQHLVVTRGSLEETRYLMLLARDLQLVAQEPYAAIEANLTEVSKLLNAILRSLRKT
ncbi:MAG: four helix bundle protein [Opitutaceae bacterium]|nr:four helix bundle protein [Opitutaceae bacterium]